MTQKKREVTRRNETFAKKTVSSIWKEYPAEGNPYIAEACRCHGYDLFELIEKRSFIEVLFLLFRGELPDSNQAKLLESLMIGQINPGPRHPSTRAAMTAGVGKTETGHVLPIALNILSGSHLGAAEVTAAMKFFKNEISNDPEQTATQTISRSTRPPEGDWHPAPGFGTRFGGIDVLSEKLSCQLAALAGAGAALAWGCRFARTLHEHQAGWLTTGVAAAVLTDLGFHPRTGAGFFQLISAPGLLAHGQEMADKPLTAMPFPSDEDYFIEN